ncbi:MAG: ATP-binding protein [Candidatus Solibacter usitatus]|nr:ATP-binding protein [Candidatus Solibacter usitatus]
MIHRDTLDEIADLLTRFPAVAILGPRQVGKTTLARMIASKLGKRAIYLDLELPSDLIKLADPEYYLDVHQQRLVILDEIQHVPDLFKILRGLIDKRRHTGKRSGHFLLLGSASLDLLRQSSESLAGRMAIVELPPFLISEAAGPDRKAIEKLWIRGGLPDSFLASSDAVSLEWRDKFVRTYLERDIPALGPRLPAATLGRLWRALAADQGQVLNASRLSASLGVSGQTVARYVDTLVDLLLVRRLPPWTRNPRKRMIRSPKIYVRDSGIAHALMGIRDLDGLLGNSVAGFSWEGFVIENILCSFAEIRDAWFYRSAGGAEIDLLLDLGGNRLCAIEVKLSLTPVPSKGFYVACEELGVARRMVVYPGKEHYRINRETEAMPVSMLLGRKSSLRATAGR